MKKGETPQFSVRWWKGSQPKGLKSASGLESALKDYETAKGKLESTGEDTDAKVAYTALSGIDKAVKPVVAEASKAKSDEMTATVDCLKKFDRLYAAERNWIEEHTEASDDGAFGDPEVYHAYLLTMLKRLRSSGEMNFGFVLGKKPEDHRLALHKSKSSKGLANILVKQTGIHQMTWGIARPDEERGGLLVLTLEGRVLPGMGKKAGRMLKKFKPLPFKKLALVVDGKEELEDLEAPDDGIDDDDLETTGETQQDGRDGQALTRELAELVRRIQGVTDPALKGDLARMATQANALLRSNNLLEARQRIDELRSGLDQAPANPQPGNGAGNAGRRRQHGDLRQVAPGLAGRAQEGGKRDRQAAQRDRGDLQGRRHRRPAGVDFPQPRRAGADVAGRKPGRHLGRGRQRDRSHAARQAGRRGESDHATLPGVPEQRIADCRPGQQSLRAAEHPADHLGDAVGAGQGGTLISGHGRRKPAMHAAEKAREDRDFAALLPKAA